MAGRLVGAPPAAWPRRLRLRRPGAAAADERRCRSPRSLPGLLRAACASGGGGGLPSEARHPLARAGGHRACPGSTEAGPGRVRASPTCCPARPRACCGPRPPKWWGCPLSPHRYCYPSDVTDEEWAFVAPYLTLMREDAPQRRHDLREVFNAPALDRARRRAVAAAAERPAAVARRSTSRPSAGWRPAASRRWSHDLRALLRLAAGRAPRADARSIFDSRTLQSTPESGAPGRLRRGQAAQGQQGARGGRHAGPPAGAARHAGQRAGPRPGRAAGRGGAGGRPARRSRSPSSTRATPATARPRRPAAHGIELEVVKLPEAKRGFVLLPRRWVVERTLRLGGALPPPGPRLRAAAPKPSPACTSSPSSPSCSPRPQRPSTWSATPSSEIPLRLGSGAVARWRAPSWPGLRSADPGRWRSTRPLPSGSLRSGCGWLRRRLCRRRSEHRGFPADSQGDYLISESRTAPHAVSLTALAAVVGEKPDAIGVTIIK